MRGLFFYIGQQLRLISPDASVRAGRVLIAQTRFGEADRLLAAALAIHPDNGDLLEMFALSANDRGWFAEALARWRHSRDRAPERTLAWCGIAANLRALGQVEDAWATIEDALQRFPDDLVVLLEATRLARLRHAVRAERDLWRRMIVIDSQASWRNAYITAQSAYFEDLLEAERFEEAAADIEDATAVLGQNPKTLVWSANLAMAREDWDALIQSLNQIVASQCHAPVVSHRRPDRVFFSLVDVALKKRHHRPDQSLLLWTEIVGRFPDNPDFLNWHIDALIRTGRLDEASRALERVRERFPDDVGALMNGGFLSMKREDWDDAVRHLESYHRKAADDAIGRELLAQAVFERAAARTTTRSAELLAGLRHHITPVDDDAKRTLLLGFESLGHNCEFGLVQRRYGAEPLGLFRWNSSDVRSLVNCFEAALDGIGDPVQTVLTRWEDVEYFVSDMRWGFGFHTFISPYEIDEDKLHPKMCRRLAFLREKFLDDLRAGEKVFVFKSKGFDRDDALGLLASIRVHGPGRLLWVTTLEATVSIVPDAMPGYVYAVAPGLYLGLLTELGDVLQVRWEIHFDDWIAICENIDHARPLAHPMS